MPEKYARASSRPAGRVRTCAPTAHGRPRSFPFAPPTVRFISHLYHPLVDESGRLDIDRVFSPWIPGRHHLWHVALFVKRSLVRIDTRQPLNAAAAHAYESDMALFRAQARACVQESIDNQYANPEPFSVRFAPISDEDFARQREVMLKQGLAAFLAPDRSEPDAGPTSVLSSLQSGLNRLLFR